YSCRRAPRPGDEHSSGGGGPESRTVGGKMPIRQRLGRPRGADGCARLPRPAKTATAAVLPHRGAPSTAAPTARKPRLHRFRESLRALARAWSRRRVGSADGPPKRPRNLGHAHRRCLLPRRHLGDTVSWSSSRTATWFTYFTTAERKVIRAN